ncbi:heme-binding protein [soil metagenome]
MPREIPEYRADDLDYLNTIQFPRFTTDDAVSLGLVAVSVIREWGLSLAVDIVLADDLVFRAKMKDTGAGNDSWLAGKAAVARHYGAPSLQVRLRHAEAGTRFEDLDFDHEKYKAHGGSIPVRVGGDIVGTITTSGEPDAIDHEAAAEAIRRYLSLP